MVESFSGLELLESSESSLLGSFLSMDILSDMTTERGRRLPEGRQTPRRREAWLFASCSGPALLSFESLEMRRRSKERPVFQKVMARRSSRNRGVTVLYQRDM